MMKKIIFLSLLIFTISSTQAQEWSAKWISRMECQSASNTWLGYRKALEIKTVPTKAIAKIAVDSKYWLWINEKLVVFEGGIKRGPNPFDTYYDEVDIAPYLKKGINTIAVQVWYFGKDGFSHKSSGRAGLIFDCKTSEFELLSNATWRCILLDAYQIAPDPLPNFRLSESNLLYDARKDIGNWQAENYNDEKFAWAMVLGKAGDNPWNKLIARPIPLFKDFGMKAYRSQRISSSATMDTIICELPYNAQITPYLKVESEEGKKIVINTDNYYFFSGRDMLLRAEYITSKGIQEYESLGWLNGHKVYYIVPKGVKVIDLKYRETGYDTEFAGSFTCSDLFLTKYWQKAQRTLYVTLRDSYMDCPDRERAQWTGDAAVESGEAFYALSTSSNDITKKWLHELVNWQRADSSMFSPVPCANWDSELPDQVASSIGYYGLWNYYLNTGDKQTLSDLYDGVKRYLEIWTKDDKGTINIRQGGWSWGDWGENIDMKIVFNSWYYLAIKGAYNMALVLNKKEDAAKYDAFMKTFKVSFNKQFWNGTSYRNPGYGGSTDDRAQALAVVSGLADKDKYPALLTVFKTEEHASPYMEKYVFEAMVTMGYVDEAISRFKKRFSPMVNDTNFSTLFEGWTPQNGTINHAWSGGGLTVLSQYVCGISPLEAGYARFQVAPKPGNLTETATTMESVKGIIQSSYKKLQSGFEINVKVPTSATAVVSVPSPKVKSIALNGKIVWKNGKFISQTLYSKCQVTDERIGFEVKAGVWKFTAKY